MNKRKCFVLLSTVLAAISTPMPSYGAWVQKESYWLYEEDQTFERNAWKLINEAWYYFDDTGYMATGWQMIEGRWYFLNTSSDESKGKMLTGWQWIDGRCYYLADEPGANHPEGAMYLSERTPDGYFVDASGAWIDDNGTIQYAAGKGVQTVFVKRSASANKTSGGSSGGGSSGGGGSGGKGSSFRPENGSQNSEIDEQEPEINQEISEPGENPEDMKEPDAEEKQYRYTVRYMDIIDKTILHTLTGVATEGRTIIIIQPVINGYHLCKGQRESFKLTGDSMNLNIYYEKEIPASPSEAQKVDWNLCFVEKGNHSNEIFRSQKGQTEEGRQLVIDFPESILGGDGYYYHSMVSSPWSIIVNGNGIQKYYIEFEKGDHLPEERDPDQENKDKLKRWLGVAKETDFRLGGREPSDQQIITKSIEESNERLLNLVSMADGVERKEFYLIAKGHVPSTVIISQTFQNIKNLSELIVDEFTIAYEKYTIMRVGFEKTYEESICNHNYQVMDKVNASCMINGHETIRCRKCGKEETVILPATGHVDADHDGSCDVCYNTANETPEAVQYRIGDVQARTIGNKIYLFRCIDDDYEDTMGNSQRMALFLCDNVIRSDIDGTSMKLNFGFNNNYKYSNIREWLLDHAADDFLHETYIGITGSYIGATWKGAYEQINDNSLMAGKEVFQLLQDRVFILSVDEALKYRDVLWKFNGSKTNNPESQVSAYSKGYYLRTPQDGGLDEFLYGDGIYAVSLVDGNIQPVNVKETGFGIRPAMAIAQG